MNLLDYSFYVFFVATTVQCYHWDGNTMYDLEYQGSDFDSEAVSWTSSMTLVTAGVKTSQCSSKTLLGGYNIMGGYSYNFGTWSKTYSGLPSHNTITFRGIFYMIDSWDVWSDHFHLYFDGYDQIMWYIWFNYANYASANLCGNSAYKDLNPMTVYFTVPHTASFLTFKMAHHTSKASNLQSVGFRDITMTFSTKSPVPSYTYCGVTSGYPLSDHVCSCGTGTTMTSSNSGVCGPCDSSCVTCNGAGPSNCTSCAAGEYLSDGVCYSCDSSCKTCNGAGSSFCTTCESPKRLSNGSCYECHASCLSCSGPGATACTSCEAGQFLSGGGSCYQCDSSCAACDGTTSSDCTACPDGEYLSAGSCYKCDSSCITCDGGGSSRCSSCSDGEYLSSGSCEECDSSCVTCNGAGSSSCTSCTPTEYLENGVCNNCDSSCATCDGAGPSKCASCPAGKYLNSGVCSDCNGSCLTCYAAGSSSCLSCIDGKYLDNGVCYECDSACLTCDGAGDSACTSCADGKYLDGSGSCNECDSTCKNCNGVGSNSCTSCEAGKYLDGTSCSACDAPCLACTGGGSNACASCISGTYLDGTSCADCDSSCATCSGGSASQCTSCISNYYSVGSACFVSCDSPLVKSSSGGINYCETPCVSGYAYLEGGCSASCDYPRTQITRDTFDVCGFPCASTSEYFYWNGSCFDNCPSPLSHSTIGTQNSCEFPCGGNFAYWDGSCESNCPVPLISETQGTYEPRKFCWYPCQPNEYLYWNGSCLSACPSPLSDSISKTQKFCDFPCLSTSEYLYYNGSCGSGCPSPLISELQGTNEPRNFCWTPCQPDQYVYWNRSCLNDCPSPLAPKIETDIKYCVNPCGDSSSYYLYSNQSCLSTCPSPLSIINNPEVQYCVNLCPAGTYLYENKSCLSSCSTPFLKRTEPDVQYCDRPCSQPNIYWYKNASCLPKCEAPYIQYNYSGVIECLAPCKDSEYFYTYEKSCNSKCESPFKIVLIDVIKTCQSDIDISLSDTEDIKDTSKNIESQGELTNGGMKAASALNSNNPSSALLAGLSSMLQYIRYMKINYPPKVQVLFLVSAGNPISLGFDFDIPSFIGDRLRDYTLPEVFEKYDINSNFVYNLWDFLATLLLILLVILGLELVRCLLARCAKINLILTKLVEAVKWNFPLMMICSSSGDVFFYGSLQIRSSPLDNLASIICFIVCILMMVVVIFIIGIAFKILKSFERHRRIANPENEANWADKWRGYEILYEEYEEKSLLSFSYMSLFVLRGLIFNLTIANLFDYPLIQCIIINIANLSMFGYLLYLRPLKNLLALVQLFINEGLVNIIGISILILAIMDKAGINGQSTRNSVGQAIIFVIKTFNTFGLVFMAIGMLIFIVSMFKIWIKFRAQGVKSPFKMLKALILGEPELKKSSETLHSSVSVVALKRPKILKPPRKQSSNHQNLGTSNDVIYLEPDSNTFNISVNQSSFVQAQFNEEQVSDIQIINLNMSQTISQESPVVEENKNIEKPEIIITKEKDVPRLALSVNTGSNSDLSGMVIQSWRSLKERMQRFSTVSSETDGEAWFASLRKLKLRLRNGSNNKVDLVLESNKNSGNNDTSSDK